MWVAEIGLRTIFVQYSFHSMNFCNVEGFRFECTTKYDGSMRLSVLCNSYVFPVDFTVIVNRIIFSSHLLLLVLLIEKYKI